MVKDIDININDRSEIIACVKGSIDHAFRRYTYGIPRSVVI